MTVVGGMPSKGNKPTNTATRTKFAAGKKEFYTLDLIPVILAAKRMLARDHNAFCAVTSNLSRGLKDERTIGP
jgi:hypothetical protein